MNRPGRQPHAGDDELEREAEDRAEHEQSDAELLKSLRVREGIMRNRVYRGTMEVVSAMEEDTATRMADTSLSPDGRAVINGSFVAIRALRLNLLELLVQNALAAQPKPGPEGTLDEGTSAREVGTPDLV